MSLYDDGVLLMTYLAACLAVLLRCFLFQPFLPDVLPKQSRKSRVVVLPLLVSLSLSVWLKSDRRFRCRSCVFGIYIYTYLYIIFHVVLDDSAGFSVDLPISRPTARSPDDPQQLRVES